MIRVLWLEDEREKVEAFEERAYLNGIELIHVESVSEFKEKLNADLNSIDACILDAMGVLKSKDEAPSLKAIGEATNFINVLKAQKYLPYYILSGKLGYEENQAAVEMLGEDNIYTKSEREGELIEVIKKEYKELDYKRVQYKYCQIFDNSFTEIFTSDFQEKILGLCMFLEGKSSESYDFNFLRKRLEDLYGELAAYKLIPPKVFNDNGWINGVKRFFKGQNDEFKMTEDYVHPLIVSLLENFLHLTQDGSHSLASKMTLKVESYINTGVNTGYVFKIGAYQLLEMIVWFKKLINKHPDSSENENLWEEKDMSEYIGNIEFDNNKEFHCNGFLLKKDWVESQGHQIGQKIKIVSQGETRKRGYKGFVYRYELI